MNNEINYVSPFKRFVISVGNLPTAYLESMSYYECITFLVNFLDKQVIPTLNHNGEVVEELQAKFTELKNYVEHYFDNLNVQEEINNKLDEMADNGELTDIIAQYLGLAGMITFDTVSDMKAAENLVDGSKCQTLGFNSINDGGSSLYKVREIINTDVIDEKILIALHDVNLVAELVNKEIYPESVGAIGNGTDDDTLSLQAAIDYAVKNKIKLSLMNKTYLITAPLIIDTKLEIEGNNAIIQTSSNIKLITANNVTSYLYIHDLTLKGSNDNSHSDNIGIYLTSFYSKFSNLLIENCYSGIYMDITGADGTLVENRYENIRVSNYREYGLYLGDVNNNKLTDGFINNVICNGANDSTESEECGIYIGSCAGYNIDGVHIYGTNTHAIHLHNNYMTNINNVYIEHFTDYGLDMVSTQAGNNVSNIQIKHDQSGSTGTAINVTVSGYLPYTTHSGNMSNIRISRGDLSTGKSIVVAGGNTHAWNVSNIIIDGSSRTVSNDCSGIRYNYLGIVNNNDFKMTKKDVDTNISYIKSYKYSNTISGDNKTFTIQLPAITSTNGKVAIDITGVGGKWNYQTGLFYKGLLYVVYNGGTYYAYINNYVNTLFTSAPTVSNSATNEITLSFDYASDTYLQLFYDEYTSL